MLVEEELVDSMDETTWGEDCEMEGLTSDVPGDTRRNVVDEK